ncbi:hypothetical protein GGS20DRAFT_588690 [Poronia punctata]|nr:hypothetical protein GGS20DRAFT_588690 [Poronia punctata]
MSSMQSIAEEVELQTLAEPVEPTGDSTLPTPATPVGQSPGELSYDSAEDKGNPVRPPTPPKRRRTPSPDEELATPAQDPAPTSSTSQSRSKKHVRFAEQAETREYEPYDNTYTQHSPYKLTFVPTGVSVGSGTGSARQGAGLGGTTQYSAASSPWIKAYDSNGFLKLPEDHRKENPYCKESSQATPTNNPSQRSQGLGQESLLATFDEDELDCGERGAALRSNNDRVSRPKNPSRRRHRLFLRNLLPRKATRAKAAIKLKVLELVVVVVFRGWTTRQIARLAHLQQNPRLQKAILRMFLK